MPFLAMYLTGKIGLSSEISGIVVTIAALICIPSSLLGVVHSYYMFILSTVIWTLGEILAVTNFGVYLADNSPSNFRARFNSAGSLSWSLGAALGTSIAGKFIHEIGLNHIWPLTFFLSILGSTGMFCIFMRGRKKEKIVAL